MEIDEQSQSGLDVEQVLTVGLEDEIRTEWPFKEIVRRNAALQPVLRQVEVVPPTDSTALITGDTGTSKELIARAIHKWSAESGCAFVSVNCVALAHIADFFRAVRAGQALY